MPWGVGMGEEGRETDVRGHSAYEMGHLFGMRGGQAARRHTHTHYRRALRICDGVSAMARRHEPPSAGRSRVFIRPEVWSVRTFEHVACTFVEVEGERRFCGAGGTRYHFYTQTPHAYSYRLQYMYTAHCHFHTNTRSDVTLDTLH